MALHDHSQPEPQPYYPGYQFDYVQITSNVTITGTTDATATTVITGNSVTYDGGTRVKIEFVGGASVSSGQEIVVVVYDGATDLGRLSFASNQTGSAEDLWLPGAMFVTPTAGAHAYSIAAWKTGAGGTVSVYGGAGGAGVTLPAWYRITKA